jgi:hypothetical protein
MVWLFQVFKLEDGSTAELFESFIGILKKREKLAFACLN